MDRFWNRLEKDKPASSSQAAPFNIHHFPQIPGELMRNPRFDSSIPRLLPLHSSEPRYLPMENIFIEIWPHSVSILHPLAFKGQLEFTFGLIIYRVENHQPWLKASYTRRKSQTGYLQKVSSFSPALYYAKIFIALLHRQLEYDQSSQWR